MAKIEIAPIGGGYNIQNLNDSLQSIRDEFHDKVVYRDEAAPMKRALDMNGFDIINVDTINGADVSVIGDLAAAVEEATDAAAAAQASAVAAANSAIQVENAKLVNRGAWNSGTAYVVNDVVGINGSSYIAKLPSTTQSPPNPSYWDVLASRGTDGASGSGSGDVSSNTASSVDGEIALFSGTAGKTIKRAAGNGIAKITNGVLGTAVQGTDFVTASAFAQTILDDTSDSAVRTTIGVYSTARVNQIPVNVSGTNIPGEAKVVTVGETLATGLTPGDVYMFYNNSDASITYTQGSGLTLRLLGTPLTGNRTLAGRGMLTLWVRTSTEYLVAGSGVA